MIKLKHTKMIKAETHKNN